MPMGKGDADPSLGTAAAVPLAAAPPLGLLNEAKVTYED